jgi:hypothetical protein
MQLSRGSWLTIVGLQSCGWRYGDDNDHLPALKSCYSCCYCDDHNLIFSHYQEESECSLRVRAAKTLHKDAIADAIKSRQFEQQCEIAVGMLEV